MIRRFSFGPGRGWRGVRLFLLCLIGAVMVQGHPGPEHEIEELTKRMEEEGESAELLIARSIEYRMLDKLAEARKDLERALELDPASVAGRRELGRVYLSLKKPDAALQALNQALAIVGASEGREPEYATLLMLHAETLVALGKHAEALKDADRAIEKHPGNVEWYLARNQLHARLGLKAERVRGLEEGIRQTGSGVLTAEWVDALIENGQQAAALRKIETELAGSRWQSSWLIRRARVRLLEGESAAAKADLEAAIAELNGRIRGSSPDPWLLADRGRAYDLLGDSERARRDYSQARDRGITDNWLAERLRVLNREAD